MSKKNFAREMREDRIANENALIRVPQYEGVFEKGVYVGIVNKDTGEVTKPRFRSIANAHAYAKDNEKNLSPSATKPGLSMTVLEMVNRHRKGLPIDDAKGSLYFGDDLIPNLKDMDLIDRAEYLDSVADALVEVRARIQANAKTSEEKEFLRKVDEEVRKQLSKIKPDVIPAPSAGVNLE